MGDRPIYLTVEGLWKLAHAVRPIEDAFGGRTVYLVGSVLERKDWRDVDLRLIMDDDSFDKMFYRPDQIADQFRMLLNVSISSMLSTTTRLPIDFQVQSREDADQFKGKRNPVTKGRPYVGPDFVPKWCFIDKERSNL